jgi:hypothetical protein
MTTRYKKRFGGSLPWETFQFPKSSSETWMPRDDAARNSAYEGYNSMYWNEDNAYSLRWIVTEQPVYIPIPRIIVDTMAHYLLKGLQIGVQDPERNKAQQQDLDDFLDRQQFLSKFHVAKHDGCIRGDYVFHMTANDELPVGQRIAISSIYAGKVVRKFDDDDGELMTDAWIVEPYEFPEGDDRSKDSKEYVRRLHYWYSDADGDADDQSHALEEDVDEVPAPDSTEAREGLSTTRQVMRALEILEVNEKLWTAEELVVVTEIEDEPLPEPIDVIPVYWFKNIPTDGQPFGSSDIRGFERGIRGISQEATDLGVGLALDGLGTFVTDASRPVDANGNETSWIIEPGMILELQNGTYFKRVDGITSITPALDWIKYSEGKIDEAAGLSSVAVGDVDAQTASNPMALSIKFLPTLAKLQEREAVALGNLKNMFWDWTKWREAYEGKSWPKDVKLRIEPGDKLPQDRTARVNELNNMLDRDIISKAYYRQEMAKLGYEFPDDLQQQINQELEDELKFNVRKGQLANQAAETAATQQGAQGDPGQMPPGVNGQKSTTLPPPGNQSNNKNKPNESKGTESGQPLAKQARGARPPATSRR